MPTIIQYQPRNSKDVVDRKLRASDLPRPMTNAQADRTTQDSINARKRALMRVSGFGDDATATDPSTGATSIDATAASGGASVAQSLLGGGLASAVGTGVVTILAATFAVRLFDSLFGSRR